jgi:hypothetical protein
MFVDHAVLNLSQRDYFFIQLLFMNINAKKEI